MTERTYLVEIHDITPAQPGALDELLALLPPTAAAAASVLVVPNWGDCWPLSAHPGFAARLRQHAGVKVLHGLTHSLGPRLADRLYFGTDDEGEFAHLDKSSAAARLDQGRRLLEDALEIPVRWFCAPRWQMSAGARQAVSDSGIGGVMTRQGMSFGDGRTAAVPVLWFDDGERVVVRAVARQIRKRRIRTALAGARPFRLVLHPRDLRLARGEIAALVAELERTGWRAVALEQLAA